MASNVSELTTYKAYLQGEWKKSSSDETIAIQSPYLRKAIGYVQAVTQDEVDEAIKAAHKAQKSWAELSLSERGAYLDKWADELVNNSEDIATAIMQEVGKGFKDAKKEVVRTADLIRYTVQEALHMHGESLRGEGFPGGDQKKIGIVERAPLGVVLAISPFNYPVNLAASKVAPALMAGNGVIFKPATQGSISGIKMIQALDKTGLPKGVLSLTTGRGSVIGDYLVEHKGIDMISFTGGSGTGRHLSKQTAMIPLVLELGGKDPALVAEDADMDVAVKSIMNGAFSYSGQRCTAIKRVLVNEKVADELVDRLKSEIEKLTVGSPEEDSTIVPLIDDKSADFVQSLIDDALNKKATLVTGNKRQDNLIYPTLLDHVTEDMDVAWIEPFGPVLPIIRVKSDEEAIELANRSEFGLQASVFSQDIDRALDVARQVEAGTVQINGRTERGPDHFPFLGVKASGMGVQGIHHSILSMSRERVTVLNLK
ncbi:NADP-dependent glyceraldehyde-3-phosphate dehydrogenase [Sporolactobacillus inulinus]|jgi:glyceraldehyde-3-phosphate dehydrogenase (NADP+)|uniref:Glyceraldehyde-3-phosphate dehydrogenase n=1 Tax=Sporolactobacillus inulinus CASD TaxID=1069536 RepID=A0A0U1QPF5_9BACL|nr:NADP-dependent glyceraldehyde-3-phosphate dehydrogenase [Sporolactobacillus inulinus]KLI02681.1 glyceraldehyde-3-phosphate dehydrogenase [Sporolactobacillus inulinus CASD]GEB76028.1 NADP-dependent glyceraldehyde-3-phosphate dehydrogenase [Sporolactobacillus inulinus]